MEYNKDELLSYIVDTIADNLHFDNLINACNIYGDELDITNNYGQEFLIKIEIDDITENEVLQNDKSK